MASEFAWILFALTMCSMGCLTKGNVYIETLFQMNKSSLPRYIYFLFLRLVADNLHDESQPLYPEKNNIASVEAIRTHRGVCYSWLFLIRCVSTSISHDISVLVTPICVLLTITPHPHPSLCLSLTI